jgi:hypothetical protein
VLAPDGSGLEIPVPLRPWSWLIGRWVGVGTGQYPTIEDFRFGQEVAFSTDGRPFLTYVSRSWLLDDDGNRIRPLATEAGFWRPRDDNRVELTLAHPTGYAEIWSGHLEITGMENARITGARAELKTDAVARTLSAKEYTDGHRLYGLVEGKLLWTYDMQAVGEPLGNHLAATLLPIDGQVESATEDG